MIKKMKKEELTAVLFTVFPKHLLILDEHIKVLEKKGELGELGRKGYRSEVIRRLIENLTPLQ